MDWGKEYDNEHDCMLDYKSGNVEKRIWFKDDNIAVAMADLIYHLGGSACVLSGIWEYSPVTKKWENMAY
jgi:hypothetical protein